MRPAGLLRLRAAAFGSDTACLGPQLSKVIGIVNNVIPSLCWYTADMQPVGFQLPEWKKQPTPVRVADTARMIEMVQRVDQFEGGVFVGVPASILEPMFRSGGLWTEDEECADLGDAIVEIRMFDTSYIMIASPDPGIIEKIDLDLFASGNAAEQIECVDP